MIELYIESNPDYEKKNASTSISLDDHKVAIKEAQDNVFKLIVRANLLKAMIAEDESVVGASQH